MEVKARRAAGAADITSSAKSLGNIDLGFIPDSLVAQCRGLIAAYHDLYGYSCLPNILWRARLGHFIEMRDDFRRLLRKASTTRSAKKSNEGFVTIATAILALEILASDFSSWSAMFPEARLIANGILQCNTGGGYAPLIQQYLYPPKYINPALFLAFVPPPAPIATEPGGLAALPELQSEKLTLGYANSMLRIMRAGEPRDTADLKEQA